MTPRRSLPLVSAVSLLVLWQAAGASAAQDTPSDVPLATADDLRPARVDWLVGTVERPSAIYRTADG